MNANEIIPTAKQELQIVLMDRGERQRAYEEWRLTGQYRGVTYAMAMKLADKTIEKRRNIILGVR